MVGKTKLVIGRLVRRSEKQVRTKRVCSLEVPEMVVIPLANLGKGKESQLIMLRLRFPHIMKV